MDFCHIHLTIFFSTFTALKAGAPGRKDRFVCSPARRRKAPWYRSTTNGLAPVPTNRLCDWGRGRHPFRHAQFPRKRLFPRRRRTESKHALGLSSATWRGLRSAKNPESWGWGEFPAEKLFIERLLCAIRFVT